MLRLDYEEICAAFNGAIESTMQALASEIRLGTVRVHSD
jgi:hypothetical protein